MKKFVVSVGLVALGATGAQAGPAPSPLDGEGSRPWSVSMRLRGFYDDNINGLPDNVAPANGHRDTFGFEVAPRLVVSWPLEQTTIGFSYDYGLKYYQNRPSGNTENYDQTHTFMASLDHTFNERYQLSLKDSFVIGQEPDKLRAGNTFDSFQRIPGNNIRNYASVEFNAQLTPRFGLVAGYANALYDYADDNFTDFPSPVPPVGVFNVTPSNSGTLDSINHTFHLDGRWQIKPSTIGVVGYQFSDMYYTAGEPISGTISNGVVTSTRYLSDVRNNRSHYGYVGVDHTFTPTLSGSLRGGARYNSYYNDPYNQNEPSPYFMASLKYAYMTSSSAELGFSYDRSASQSFSELPGQSLTTDAQTATAWLSVRQKITGKLTGTLTAQFQDSTYNGGTLNGETDLYYLLGLNLEYRFNPHFAMDTGYNYDRLDSDLSGRSFDRNRVYIGLTATY